MQHVALLRSCGIILDFENDLCSICSVFGSVSSYQRQSSALPSALSSPVEGSLVHFESHPSLFPAPLFLSGNAWHPPLLEFSHTFHTGCSLGGDEAAKVNGQMCKGYGKETKHVTLICLRLFINVMLLRRGGDSASAYKIVT